MSYLQKQMKLSFVPLLTFDNVTILVNGFEELAVDQDAVTIRYAGFENASGTRKNEAVDPELHVLEVNVQILVNCLHQVPHSLVSRNPERQSLRPGRGYIETHGVRVHHCFVLCYSTSVANEESVRGW